MVKLRAWRYFSAVMVLVLTLGVCAMAMPTSPALANGAVATWDLQTVDDCDVWDCDIALDSNGYPHISYSTFAPGDNSLHYARWTGTAWATEMVDDEPARANSLALDSNGYPHISYGTFAPGDNSLHYAHWTGTAWVKETLDERDVWDCEIALDSNGYPHISYTLADSAFLQYAHWTGTAWETETVDEGPALPTSIALDSNNRPHISYATFPPLSLHYARWTGTAWAKEMVDAVDVNSTSIALDSNGYPHISYTTGGFGSLHYAHWTGTAWDIQTVDESDNLHSASIALDSSGYPHISYASVSFDSLYYAHWTGTAWETETVDTRDVGPTSIALDSSDYPHISYATGGLASLHYARLIPPDTATVDTATGTGTATFFTSGGGIAKLTAVAQTATNCPPTDIFFPQGLFSFNILGLNPGATVTVTITLPSVVPAGTLYWKCQNGTWIDCTSLLGDNDGDNVLTLTFTDGGLGDADGVANGTIIDPGGPVVIVAASSSTAAAGPRSSPTVPHPLNPSQMSLQYLSITPQQTSAGQPVTITTNAVNTGDEAGNINVTLKINGQLEQSRMVSVGPHGTQPVKFTVTKAQPGTYNVDILGKSGSFTILGAGGAGGTGGSKNIGLIVLVLIGILVVASVVVLLVRRT
jgi:hypothetical protein